MKKVAKKRVGRPPGRTAPWRPVLSYRVSELLYGQLQDAARASGRTLSEEASWRLERSFELSKSVIEVRATLAESQRLLAAGHLKTELQRQGFTSLPIAGEQAWFPPSMGPTAFENMLEQAATRAVAKSEITKLVEIENLKIEIESLIERAAIRALQKFRNGET